MKIVIFSPYEQPYAQTSRNFDFAIRLVSRGHEVTVFTNNFCHRSRRRFYEANGLSGRSVANFKGVKVVWLDSRPYFDNGIGRAWNALSFVWLALTSARREIGLPDVVIADSVPPTAGLLGWAIAKSYRARFIYQIRDVWPIALVYDGALRMRSPIYWILRVIEKFLYKRADSICSSLRNVLEHIQSSGADPRKVVWIPNGVDLDRFAVVSPSQRDGVKVGGERYDLRVVYTGGYGNAHDVLSIIRAASLTWKSGYRFLFDLYGDGVKRAGCEQFAREEIVANVRFFDSVPRESVPDILSTADVLVAAVTDSDAYQFGLNLNKLYDYFAAARPVVLSCRAAEDPVRDGGCGFTVSPECPLEIAEALIRLHGLGEMGRAEMGAKARRFAETHYDVNRLADVYEQMVKK
jgi:glycosyltransferase involved in cell wall biosynthesis